MKESVLEQKLSLHAISDKRWFDNKAKFAAEILKALLPEVEGWDRHAFKDVIKFCEAYKFDDEE